jgi:hypothetical protein
MPPVHDAASGHCLAATANVTNAADRAMRKALAGTWVRRVLFMMRSQLQPTVSDHTGPYNGLKWPPWNSDAITSVRCEASEAAQQESEGEAEEQSGSTVWVSH